MKPEGPHVDPLLEATGIPQPEVRPTVLPAKQAELDKPVALGEAKTTSPVGPDGKGMNFWPTTGQPWQEPHDPAGSVHDAQLSQPREDPNASEELILGPVPESPFNEHGEIRDMPASKSNWVPPYPQPERGVAPPDPLAGPEVSRVTVAEANNPGEDKAKVGPIDSGEIKSLLEDPNYKDQFKGLVDQFGSDKVKEVLDRDFPESRLFGDPAVVAERLNEISDKVRAELTQPEVPVDPEAERTPKSEFLGEVGAAIDLIGMDLLDHAALKAVVAKGTGNGTATFQEVLKLVKEKGYQPKAPNAQ